MRVAILAGGLRTRLSEETGVQHRPVVDIGGRPILGHFMKAYPTFVEATGVGLEEGVRRIVAWYRNHLEDGS